MTAALGGVFGLFTPKSLSAQQSLELIAQKLDELSSCLEQLENYPACTGRLPSGPWNDRFAAVIADMRENIAVLERSAAVTGDVSATEI